ncbi:hypothetical protein [uncultured Pontibacter sp.]|uniref:hypothetical protein n=1 Tax=uncultured Pontibacter sp. TaxID=453356 RepID=UPI002630CE75|nr:hypothetical protein [uncultured Pontibacter sp.]
MLRTKSITLGNYTAYLPVLLFLLWLLMQAGVYYAHGVRIVFDSHRYLDEADKLLSTGDLAQLRISYLSYSAILALCIAVFGNAKAVVLVQIIVGGLSTVAFYRLALVLLQGRLLAYFATGLLLLWPLYQHWHFYIHTESLFASLSIVAFYRVVSANKLWHYIQLLLLLIILTFLRANGFMVPLAVLAYAATAYWLRQGHSLRLLLLMVAIGGLGFTVALAHFFLGDMAGIHSFTGHLVSGNIIQGYNKISFVPQQELVLSGSPLAQVGQLVWQEPAFFMKKSLGRIFYYWSQMRPYISFRYKVAIVVFLYPLYVLAAIGLWKQQLPKPFILAIAVLSGLFTAMVVVSGVDWDNRFMMPLLPYLYLSAAAGLKTFGVWHDDAWELNSQK